MIKFSFMSFSCPELDLDEMMAVAKRYGYDDFLSGEWINWEPYETHLPRELSTMKRYEQEAS
ncbi:MAG: hypothetical protein Q7J67_08480 [bacterium]|nr:hypothetical protein [bacterium]